MHLATLNVKNNPDMPRRWVREDARRVSALTRTRPLRVVLWQEIGEAEDLADIGSRLWPHRTIHGDTRQPITVSPGFKVLARGVEPLHQGLARVSPGRIATWAILAHPHPRAGRFAVVNVHYVSGAFSNPGQRGEAWRDLQWDVGHQAVAALVKDLRADGLPVMGGGDFNRRGDVPDLTPMTRWVAGSGYDHLFLDTGLQHERPRWYSHRFQVHRGGFHTDHPLVLAQVKVVP